MVNVNFFSHLLELKLRIWYLFFGFCVTFIVSYSYASQLISLLSKPLLKFLMNDSSDLIFVNVFEVLNTYINVSLYTTFFLYMPIFIYIVFLFLKPGLFKSEKTFLLYLYKFFLQLLLISFVLSYYVIIPSILSFLLTLDIIVNPDFLILKMQTKLYDYITFICEFITLYCITFCEFFLFMISLIYLEFFNSKALVQKRRFIIIICLLIGCVFSSPDLLSLFMSSVPLVVFFEITLFMFILKNKYKKEGFFMESCLNGKRQVC
uniref:Twin-arginine translocase subunit TatC n=1 Tax=Guillardia theta TaxID=55529 RepID=A0A481WAX2_GUITH|nr:twin-arginine translocase subunit TatC [Guillardia theta]QBJ06292.1 twin-arginine translocase subunit TatC [Guillardia theta]